MLNAASMRQKDDSDGDGGSASLVEVGVGYHRKLAGNIVWENYALLGGGRVENHFPSTVAAAPATTGNLEAKFTRYGLGDQFMIDPALTFRAGFNPIKLQLQLGLSKNVTTSSFRQREGYIALGALFYWRH